jgi:hypothetical protein
LIHPHGPRIHELLREGWALLQAGRGREAGDVFGRVLLLDPGFADARRGFEQARRAAAEEHRGLDARIDEALVALDAGDADRARELLEEVVTRGGDRDRALALLDRLAPQRGRIDSQPAAIPEAPPAPTAVPPRHGAPWRRALVAVWVVVFALLGAGLVLGWDRLVAGLIKAPTPVTTEASR